MDNYSAPMQPNRPDTKVAPVSSPVRAGPQQQSELSFLLQLRRALKRELGRIEKRIDDLKAHADTYQGRKGK